MIYIKTIKASLFCFSLSSFLLANGAFTGIAYANYYDASDQERLNLKLAGYFQETAVSMPAQPPVEANSSGYRWPEVSAQERLLYKLSEYDFEVGKINLLNVSEINQKESGLNWPDWLPPDENTVKTTVRSFVSGQKQPATTSDFRVTDEIRTAVKMRFPAKPENKELLNSSPTLVFPMVYSGAPRDATEAERLNGKNALYFKQSARAYFMDVKRGLKTLPSQNIALRHSAGRQPEAYGPLPAFSTPDLQKKSYIPMISIQGTDPQSLVSAGFAQISVVLAALILAVFALIYILRHRTVLKII